MKAQEFQTIVKSRLSKLSTEDLIEQVKSLSLDLRKEVTIIFETALSILEERLPENEFIQLCDSL